MSRPRFLFAALLSGWIAAVNLCAQSPAKPVAASPPPVSPASSTAVPTIAGKSLVDSMDSADLKEAIQLLKDNYIKPEALNETELDRATFQGLLTRLGRGVILLGDTGTEVTEPPAPFFGEILESHIGYLRLGDLSRPNLEALDEKLKAFEAARVDALVVDLRASGETNDFALASEFAMRFCPKSKPLFSLRETPPRHERAFTSERDPSYEGLTIVLTDGDTAGAAEAIAGAIRYYDKALIIGQPTAGRAVEYSDLKLPSGKILRVAVGEAILPENRPLFPEGVRPDVPVEMRANEKRDIFRLSTEQGMTPFVVETERPHMNEAALLSGRNPELEAMEAAQRRGRAPEKIALRDPVLMRALDLVISVAIFEKR